MNAPIVIVGSGLAGYTVAREVRKLDPAASIVVVTQDSGDFYSKPMLSNALALGRTPDQLVATPAAAMRDQLKIELLPATAVRAIDRGARRLTTSAGATDYSRLVIAAGADPIGLALAGDATEAVLSVNDLADYTRFRHRLRVGARVAIIGGGLIGCEFANDLALGGFSVTVIDPMPHPLASLLPAPAAAAVHAALADAGVTWRLGTGVVRVDRTADALAVGVTQGAPIVADIVLSAVGLRPRTALAKAAGLVVNRGIVVDRFARTSDVDIVAIGDCAEYEGQVLPYVMPIMNAARSLAKTLLGEASPVMFPAMPVIVKTPACPVAVIPAPRDLQGTWETEHAAEGIRMLFRDPDGNVRGFALTGGRCAERQALAKRVSTPADAPGGAGYLLASSSANTSRAQRNASTPAGTPQ